LAIVGAKLVGMPRLKVEFFQRSALLVKSPLLARLDGRERYFRSYAESALCEPIDQQSFAKLLGEYSESLLHPIPPWLKELNGF
jgi:hypothetical protein